MSVAQRLARKPADMIEAFAAKVQRDARPCEYGHLHCSDENAGACSDELEQLLRTDEDEEG